MPPGEVVGQPFQIIGTDDTGPAIMDATIVVSREDAPQIKVPISEQIKKFGDYSSPSSILAYPTTDFKYAFDANTFRHSPRMINYYASSGNSSPLPAWISFDSSTLTFSGTTPAADALFQPPQQFDIRLIASDIEGFSSTSVEFSIVVTTHKLTADNPIIELNATRESSFKYKGLVDGIKLDNKAVGAGEINVTATNLPSWVTFDPDTWIIEGEPGKGDRSTNFTLSFKDDSTDTLNVWAMVNVATSGLFKSTFRNVEVTPGEQFTLDLAEHFKHPDDIEAKISTKPAQNWLSLKNQKLQGKVPKSASGDLEVTIEARSRSSGQTERESLGMMFLSADGRSTTTATTTVTEPSQNPRESDGGEADDDADKDDDDDDDDDGLGTNAILLATILPIVAVALLIMLLVCFIRRRRNRRNYLSEDLRAKISRPVSGSLRINSSSQGSGSLASSEVGGGSQVLRAEKGGYAQAHSHPSSRSSDTLGSLSSQDMSRLYMYNAGPETSRILGSSDTEGGRESWFTDNGTPTALRSELSTRSRGSQTTLPFSTHQLLPTPPFLAQTGGGDFRSGLDLAIPSLDELNSAYALGDQAPRRPIRSEAMYSTITTSSAALPLSRPGSPPSQPLPPIATAMSTALAGGKRSKSSSEKDWSTIREDESEERLPELHPPGHARLSSQQWLSRRNGATRDSLFSIASFGSTENWRIIGRPEQSAPNLSTYRSIVDMAPFNPNRPETPPVPVLKTADEGQSSTPAADAAAAAAATSAGGSRESEEVMKTSRSRYSRLNYSTSSVIGGSANWRREDSGKASEGSFKVFL